MSWQLDLAIRGNLQTTMKALTQAEAAGVTTVIRRRTTALKTAIRKQVITSGLGPKLANAIRSEVIPRRGSAPDAVGRVFSKALTKRPGGLVDLITVFETGATVRARGQSLLALPTPAAGRRGRRGARSTPADFPKGSLIVIRSRNGRTLLLVAKDDPTTVLFILVPQVRLRKRLAIAQAYARAMKGLDDAVANEIERRMTRLGILTGTAA